MSYNNIVDYNTTQRRRVLVTGASSGVGRSVAVLLSDKYDLVIHGRNSAKLDETKALCSHLASVTTWLYDFSSVADLEESFNSFLDSSNIKVNAFVHSAGTVEVLPLRSMTLDKASSIMNTNFMSAYIISKVLSQKKINGTELKNIAYISSNISARGAKGFSAYAASKGAIDSLTRCLAVELAPRVRVNSILPGGMRTEMTEKMGIDSEVMNRMEATYPLGMGTPADIAGVVKFLLSDDAKWMTGQQITVDGGRTVDITG